MEKFTLLFLIFFLNNLLFAQTGQTPIYNCTLKENHWDFKGIISFNLEKNKTYHFKYQANLNSAVESIQKNLKPEIYSLQTEETEFYFQTLLYSSNNAPTYLFESIKQSMVIRASFNEDVELSFIALIGDNGQKLDQFIIINEMPIFCEK